MAGGYNENLRLQTKVLGNCCPRYPLLAIHSFLKIRRLYITRPNYTV